MRTARLQTICACFSDHHQMLLPGKGVLKWTILNRYPVMVTRCHKQGAPRSNVRGPASTLRRTDGHDWKHYLSEIIIIVNILHISSSNLTIFDNYVFTLTTCHFGKFDLTMTLGTINSDIYELKTSKEIIVK